MTIKDDYIAFCNEIITGEQVVDKPGAASVIRSENTMKALQQRVSNIINKSSSEIDQKVVAKKNITVDCGKNQLTDFHLKPRKKKYTWWGSEIDGSGCPSYGCCYDVSQVSNIRLSSVNSTVIQDKERIFNEVSQELTAQVDLTVSGGSGNTSLQKAISSAENTSLEAVERVLENLSKNDVETSQNIEIVSEGPLACINECDETPTAGAITQSLNVDIASKNIVSIITEKVYENYITMESETSTTVTDTDIKKIYSFIAAFVVSVIGVYIGGWFIAFGITKILKAVAQTRPVGTAIEKGQDACGCVYSIFALLFVYFFYKCWIMVMCFISDQHYKKCGTMCDITPGKFGCFLEYFPLSPTSFIR
jgi:hypothetical protein